MFIVYSFVQSFNHSSDCSWFVRPIVQSFVRLFVQVIFVQSLCCRNSHHSSICSYSLFIFHHLFIWTIHRSSFVHMTIHRSFIVTIHHSSFVHSQYSSFIVRSYELFIVRSYGLFTVHWIVHSHYSLFIGSFILLFIVTIYQSSDHPNIQLLIHHVVQLT
jgi:hypothetical protein